MQQSFTYQTQLSHHTRSRASQPKNEIYIGKFKFKWDTVLNNKYYNPLSRDSEKSIDKSIK